MNAHALTPAQADRIDRLVAEGHFVSREAALQAALDLLDADTAKADALVHRLERARQQALDGHLVEGTAEEVIRNAFAKARGA